MEIRELRYFIEVARELNITKAAANLNMAQPPLSRQIKLLEEELGVELFDRTKKQIKLTKEGHLLYARAKQIIELADKTKEEIKASFAGHMGTIYIGTVEGRGPNILSKCIKSFRNEHPNVNIVIWNGSTDDVVERLSNGLLDLALIMEPVNNELLESITMEQVPWIAMINKDNPISHKEGDTIELKELKDQAIILPSRKSRVLEIKQWFLEAGIDLTTSIEISSYLNARELAKQGVGVAIFPSTSELESKEVVVEKRIVNPERIASYAFVWDKRKTPSVLGEMFIRHIVDNKLGEE